MSARPLVLAVVACLALGACAPRYSTTVAGPKGESAQSGLTLHELLVRHLVAEEPARDLILVSFGESRLDEVDPPPSFFARLAGLDVSLQPVSHYDRSQDPNALLLIIHVVAMASETEASVAVTRFRYAVGAADGFTAEVQWHDGVWRIARTSRHWNT